mmetsp:Transcript_4314/g.12621  ORF Transcript_4314/g.12621 Transcript_4314/m.12621 type:complete len:275 (+) Transcript_4314:340-1164(+)
MVGRHVDGWLRRDADLAGHAADLGAAADAHGGRVAAGLELPPGGLLLWGAGVEAEYGGPVLRRNRRVRPQHVHAHERGALPHRRLLLQLGAPAIPLGHLRLHPHLGDVLLARQELHLLRTHGGLPRGRPVPLLPGDGGRRLRQLLGHLLQPGGLRLRRHQGKLHPLDPQPAASWPGVRHVALCRHLPHRQRALHLHLRGDFLRRPRASVAPLRHLLVLHAAGHLVPQRSRAQQRRRGGRRGGRAPPEGCRRRGRARGQGRLSRPPPREESELHE